MGRETKGTELQTVEAGIVMPAVSTEGALKAWQAYLDLKAKVLDESDFLELEQWDGKLQKKVIKRFPKKSAWRKLGTFFNLSCECTEERHEPVGEATIFYATYKAIAPNGRYSFGDGACDTHEKRDKAGNPLVNTLHNTRGTAHTRAFNRAVSNLVGGGEVSAEEVTADAPGHAAEHTTSQMPTAHNGNGEDKSNLKVTPPMLKMMWAVARDAKVGQEDVRALIGEHASQIEPDANGKYTSEGLADMRRGQWEAIIKAMDPAALTRK